MSSPGGAERGTHARSSFRSQGSKNDDQRSEGSGESKLVVSTKDHRRLEPLRARSLMRDLHMSKALAPLLVGATLLLGAMPARAQTKRVSGLWEGGFHRDRGDQPIALVLCPRGTSSFAGMVYLDGEEFGPIEDGRLHGDSLTFRAANYPFLGTIRGPALSLTLMVPHGSAHSFSLTRTA